MMQIGVIGINHRSGPLSLREKLGRIFQFEFGGPRLRILNSVLLTTCNRIELYFSSHELVATHIMILHRLNQYDLIDFHYALYSYFGRDCFFHLGRVITGMDSAIFGESDIQHQVKLAYEKRRKQCLLSHDLHYLFQKGLKIGKELRTSFFTQSKEKELPAIIESVTKWLGYDLKKASVLLIGNSMLNRKIISSFRFKGYHRLSLCTRMKGVEIPFVSVISSEELDRWGKYDIVISATHHNTFILKERSVDIKGETVIFDLGVPRNVDPKLSRDPSIHLYHLNQLATLFSEKEKKKLKERVLCSDALNKIVAKQMRLFAKKREDKKRYASPQGVLMRL